jgi:16S rRNA processing protein RimM
MTDEPGDPRAAPDHLIVGHVSKPHGTRGEVFVWPLTDRPDEIFAAGREVRVGEVSGHLTQDAPTTVVEGEPRPFKRGLLVKFAGLDDRAAVETLSGRYLLVPMGEIAPLAEGEIFYHQLLGLVVETVEGGRVGTVREVYETEPAHLLEVRGDDGRTHLVPFAERIVKTVDVEGRRLVIKPPPGLLEL